MDSKVNKMPNFGWSRFLSHINCSFHDSSSFFMQKPLQVVWFGSLKKIPISEHLNMLAAKWIS